MEVVAAGLSREDQTGLLYLEIGRGEPPQIGGQCEQKSCLGEGEGLRL